MNILALDLGKFNTTCCFFDTDTQEHSFWNAATTRSYLTSVFRNNDIDLVVTQGIPLVQRVRSGASRPHASRGSRTRLDAR